MQVCLPEEESGQLRRLARAAGNGDPVAARRGSRMRPPTLPVVRPAGTARASAGPAGPGGQRTERMQVASRPRGGQEVWGHKLHCPCPARSGRPAGLGAAPCDPCDPCRPPPRRPPGGQRKLLCWRCWQGHCSAGLAIQPRVNHRPFSVLSAARWDAAVAALVCPSAAKN